MLYLLLMSLEFLPRQTKDNPFPRFVNTRFLMFVKTQWRNSFLKWFIPLLIGSLTNEVLVYCKLMRFLLAVPT